MQTGVSSSLVGDASRSSIFLIIRQIVVQVLNLAANFLLARVLSPSEFAINSIVSIFIAFLLAFGGTGLASAFLRQENEPDDREYAAITLVQLIVVFIFVLAILLASPEISSYLKYGRDGIIVFDLLAVSFVFVGLTVIPQVKMERRLEFNKIAVIETSQVLVYTLCVVLLAYLGFGILSFGFALLSRYISAFLVTYLLTKFTIRLSADIKGVTSQIIFGVNVQLAQIINLSKDIAIPAIVGGIYGTSVIGYIGWATLIMNYPTLVIIILNRIYVPFFAKLAANKVLFIRVISVVASLVCSAVFFISSIIFLFKEEINIYLFQGKWTPALNLFLPFMIINVFLAPTMIVIQALIALGKASYSLYLSISWAILTWLVIWLVMPKFGWQSWGWLNLIVNFVSIFTWIKLYSISKFNMFSSIYRPIFILLIVSISTIAISDSQYLYYKFLIAAVSLFGFFIVNIGNYKEFRVLRRM